jgi:hypothetical protein
MERRKYIATAGAALALGLAGCGSSDGNGNGNGDGNGSETTENLSLEDFVNLVSHRTAYISSNVGLEVTVENVSDSELSGVVVESNLYVENERVGDTLMRVNSLPSGVQDTAEMMFLDLDPRDRDQITNYDIIISTTPDTETYEKTYEFEDFTWPPEQQ